MSLMPTTPLNRSRKRDIFQGWITSLERSFSTLGRTSLSISGLLRIARSEFKYWEEYPLPRQDRLRAWRHGFTSRDYTLLNLDTNDPDDYLSSIQQARLIRPAVNEKYHDMLRNKVAFYLATRQQFQCVPKLYGTIRDGLFASDRQSNGYQDLATLVDNETEVIVKPITGSMGREVYRIRNEGEGYSVNGEVRNRTGLLSLMNTLDHSLACEFIEQHEYAQTICPNATNTMRILTVEDPDNQEMFVASAVHRFGNISTGPVDNWSGGGYAAPIDLNTGEFGQLHSYSRRQGLERMESHPDSETQVAGETIPNWGQIKDTVLEVAEFHSEIPYVGWDVVLSPDGPMILEGNAAPHVALQQLGGGILADERVNRFFAKRLLN